MSEDLLKEATRALREETAEQDDADGRFTRARVMASLHQGRVKRRTRLAFVLPLAACLAAGTAWGAATGRLPAVFHAIGQLVSYEAKPLARAKPRTPSQQTEPRPVAPVAASPSEPSSAPAAEPAPESPKPTGTALSALSAPAKPSAAPSASAAFRDTDGDLYRLAHEAHFSSHDYARALAGWDAYLRAAPSGRLATEARYNRALCLLRLGRDDEAKRALQPFASGMFGYRQSEARQLLDELARPRTE